MMMATAISATADCVAADAIYKCSTATGAVTFSAKPCVGSTQVKKIEPRAAVVGAEPVLPGNIPGRRGQLDQGQQGSTKPQRTPMPPVLESCRKELFDLKRVMDARFSQYQQNLKNERAALAHNVVALQSDRRMFHC